MLIETIVSQAFFLINCYRSVFLKILGTCTNYYTIYIQIYVKVDFLIFVGMYRGASHLSFSQFASNSDWYKF